MIFFSQVGQQKQLQGWKERPSGEEEWQKDTVRGLRLYVEEQDRLDECDRKQLEGERGDQEVSNKA